MVARLLCATLLLLTGWGASEAHSQQPGLCPPPGAADSAAREPDLVIRASARAAELRFRSEPRVEVRLTGCSVLDTVRVIERRNLPDPVQPGVTYRDVFVAVEILGFLDVQCLLPQLAPGPRGEAPDAAAPPRPGSALGRLCRLPAADSVPRPPPRR